MGGRGSKAGGGGGGGGATPEQAALQRAQDEVDSLERRRDEAVSEGRDASAADLEARLGPAVNRLNRLERTVTPPAATRGSAGPAPTRAELQSLTATELRQQRNANMRIASRDPKGISGAKRNTAAIEREMVRRNILFA